ncbi:MAG TPA: hypothetical protein VF544_02745 [Pyrinomonadaceae bacterium]
MQQKILNDYEGGYSIGVTLNPQNRSEAAIRLRKEGEDADNIPSHITLDGESVPIILHTNFKIPVPLGRGRVVLRELELVFSQSIIGHFLN